MLVLSIILWLLALAIIIFGRSRQRPWLALPTIIIALITLLLYLALPVARLLGAQTLDESVLYHLINGAKGAPTDILWWVGAGALVTLVICILLGVWLYQRIRKHGHVMTGYIVTLLILLSFLSHPVINHSARTWWLYASATSSQPKSYKVPAEIKFTAHPNIVYIYLESLENTFFDAQHLPDLAPQLSKLTDSGFYFTDIDQTYGTGWTMAGMVASQCGIPLSTDIWNSMSGLGSFLSGATCLGNILAEEKYNLNYMGGADMAFSGKGAFYRSHGFQHIDGQKELAPKLEDQDYQNEWGLYDDSLLAMARQRFDKLASQNKPFGLFMLTNSTHHPRGNLPQSCRDKPYSDVNDPILDAVQCTDGLVASLIKHIRHSPAGKNTIIVLGSDHLAMRSATWKKWLKGQHRRDFLLILPPEKMLHGDPRKVDKPGTTLDVGATLLGMMSNQHALGFGRDLLADKPTMREQRSHLATYLESELKFINTLWAFPKLDDGISVDPDQRKAKISSQQVDVPVLLKIGKHLELEDIVFPSRNDYFGLSAYVADLDRQQDFVWLDQCGELKWLGDPDWHWDDTNLCMVAGNLSHKKFAYKRLEKPGVDWSRSTIEHWLENKDAPKSAYKKRRKLLDEIRTWRTANHTHFKADGHGGITIVAGGGTGRRAFITHQDDKIAAGTGLNLFGIDANGKPAKLITIDSCAKQADSEPTIASLIDKHNDDYVAFAVIGERLQKCKGHLHMHTLMAHSPFTGWEQLAPEDAYVGLVTQSGKTMHQVIPNGISLAIKAQGILPAKQPSKNAAINRLNQ